MKEQDIFSAKTFTMVEENFELRRSEISPNEGTGYLFKKTFTMAEENFELGESEISLNERTRHFLNKNFHHG